MTDFISANAELCIGCRTCEIACSLAHCSRNTVDASNFFPRLQLNKLSEVSVPVMCHQCENAPCVSACPTQALTIGEHAVIADSRRCIGCKGCMVACPFGAITIDVQPQSRETKIIKCDLCASQPQGPACVSVCPTQALKKVSASEVEELKMTRIASSCAGNFPVMFR